MRVLVAGAGAVGGRAARQLASSVEVRGVGVSDRIEERAAAVVGSLGPSAWVAPWGEAALDGVDALVVAAPDGAGLVSQAIDRGVAVASAADSIADVEALLALDGRARERGITVVAGAGMAPGLTCVLARFASAPLDGVDEIHVAKAGTGGPSCARQHHLALNDVALDWRDGEWARRTGGSGRELCWFPDPACGLDCYRAALPDALLLVPAFPGVSRVTARMAATRRDRLTAALPMLRTPHPEGELGAVRVEVRGRRGAERVVDVLGAIDRPAVAAGAVCALAAVWSASGRLTRPGVGGLAALVAEPGTFLSELARRGVKVAVFEGAMA